MLKLVIILLSFNTRYETVLDKLKELVQERGCHIFKALRKTQKIRRLFLQHFYLFRKIYQIIDMNVWGHSIKCHTLLMSHTKINTEF